LRTTETRNEEGSILVMALVVLSVIGLVVGVALNYANSSLRATNKVYKPERTKLYDAESAVQTAIQYVNQNPIAGAQPVSGVETCPTSALTYPGASGNITVNVCPQAGSFVPRGRPQAVLLTLAPLGGPAGLSKQGGSSGQLLVQGDAWINSSVANNGTGGMTFSNGRLFARGTCQEPITVVAPGTKNCNLGSAPSPSISQDPNYQPAISSLPAAGHAVGCDAVHHVLTLAPGTYDGTLLGSLTNACSTTGGIVLAPGSTDAPADSTYYFHDLTLPGGRVVAGTAVASWLNNPTDDTTFGSRCDEAQRGVQLVLGANATMDEGPGDQFEACGFNSSQVGQDPNAGHPRMVLYGLKNSIGGTSAQSGTATFAANTASNGTAPIQFTRSAGYPSDGSTATATLPDASTTQTSSIVNTNFTSTDTIPAGATISSVVLRIPHDESIGQVSPSVTWTGGGCTAGTSNIAPRNVATPVPTDDVALACTNPAAAGLTATYSVTTPKNKPATAVLGRMQLIVNWTIPANPGAGGPVCTTVGCQVLRTHGSGGNIHFAGTVYMPTGALDMQVSNQSVAAVTDSVVAYTLSLSASSSIGSLPSIGGGSKESTDGDLVFDAFVGGTRWISSRVKYASGGAAPASIKTWVIKP
jgi:hypothetical protein